MTYPLVIYVSLMTICVFVPGLCQPSQCNLTTSNRFIKSGQWPSFSSHDSRDLVEYFVTYINDDDERVTFDMTNTTNSTRFQPMRWFNINQKIVYIMPMIYDYYFSITRYFMNIQTIHIDLNVTPKDCIYSIDYEEVEILTRKFFIDNVLFADSQFCSANIVDQNGIGVVSFNCCKVAESPNETVCSEINEGVTYLTSVNIAAIIASTFILGVIFVLILLSPTGTEDFYFYPKNMLTFEEKEVEKMKISVYKRQCVNENYSAITFFRCITEFLTGLDNSFCKPSENLNKCFGCCYNDCSSCICCSEKPSENPNKYFGCCYNKCSCICCSKDHPILFPFIRFYLGKLVFVVFSLMFFLPYYLFVVKFYNDSMASNILCSAVEAKGLSCPFYVKNTSNLFKYLFWAYCVLLCGYLIFVPRDNYITMIIPELPWTKSKDTSCSSRLLEYIQIVVNLGLIIFVYVTWGFLLYFYIALILRILIMSSRTRNILDDFSFVIFPLFLVVYDYITNVTKEFKVIAENIFDLVRNDKEFKCSSNNPNEKTNEAFLLSGEDQNIEYYKVGETRLNVNCPFIFRRRDGRMYTSKRLVTQIYNDSPECLPFELSTYLMAFLMSLVPCTLYAIAFLVFVTYTSILSSTQVAGFTATILTGLKWLQSNVGAFLREILIPKESAKLRVKEKLKQERLNFHEAWTVAIDYKEDTVSSEQSNKKVEENPQQSDTQNKENPQQSGTQNKENPQQSGTQNKNTQVESQTKFKKKSTDNSKSKRKKKDTIEMEEFNEEDRLLENSQDNPTYSANA